MADCEERRCNEIEALKAIYGDDFEELEGKDHFKIRIRNLADQDEEEKWICLEVLCGVGYPDEKPAKVSIDNSARLTITKAQKTKLLRQINQKCSELCGNEVTFELVQLVSTFLEQLVSMPMDDDEDIVGETRQTGASGHSPSNTILQASPVKAAPPSELISGCSTPTDANAANRNRLPLVSVDLAQFQSKLDDNNNSLKVDFSEHFKQNQFFVYSLLGMQGFYAMMGHASCTKGSKILCFGGRKASTSNESALTGKLVLFDPNKGTCKPFLSKNPPPDRYFHTMVEHKDFIYVFGGRNAQEIFGDMWILWYDRFDSGWIFKEGSVIHPERPTPRYGHSMISLAPHPWLLLFGGCTDYGYDSQFYSYNAHLDKWILPEVMGLSLPDARAGAAMCMVGKKVYLFGGNNSEKFFNDIYEITVAPPGTEERRLKFTVRKIFPSGCLIPPLTHAQMFTLDDKNVIVYGGMLANNEFVDTCYVFNIEQEKWMSLYMRSHSTKSIGGIAFHSINKVRNSLFVVGGLTKPLSSSSFESPVKRVELPLKKHSQILDRAFPKSSPFLDIAKLSFVADVTDFEYKDTLNEDLYKAFCEQDPDQADLCFYFDQQHSVYAHSFMIEARCPVMYEEMLRSTIENRHRLYGRDDSSLITIYMCEDPRYANIDYDAFYALLKFLYSEILDIKAPCSIAPTVANNNNNNNNSDTVNPLCSIIEKLYFLSNRFRIRIFDADPFNNNTLTLAVLCRGQSLSSALEAVCAKFFKASDDLQNQKQPHHHQHKEVNNRGTIEIVSNSNSNSKDDDVAGTHYYKESNNNNTGATQHETRLRAHKLILIARSEYFRSMLTLGFSEGNQNSIFLPQEHIQPDTMRALLYYFYTGRIPDVSPSICIDLYMNAYQLNISALKGPIRKAIRQFLDIDTVVDVIGLAECYGDEHLTTYCCMWLARADQARAQAAAAHAAEQRLPSNNSKSTYTLSSPSSNNNNNSKKKKKKQKKWASPYYSTRPARNTGDTIVGLTMTPASVGHFATAVYANILPPTMSKEEEQEQDKVKQVIDQLPAALKAEVLSIKLKLVQ